MEPFNSDGIDQLHGYEWLSGKRVRSVLAQEWEQPEFGELKWKFSGWCDFKGLFESIELQNEWIIDIRLDFALKLCGHV